MAKTTKRNVTTSREYRATLQHGSWKMEEKNDCAVIAVTIATGLPYTIVWGVFQDVGRVKGKGTFHHHTRMVLDRLGYDVIRRCSREFIDQYPGKNVNKKYVTTHHMTRFPKAWDDGNVYLLQVNGHICCVKEGKNQDWSIKRSLKVKEILQIVKR